MHQQSSSTTSSSSSLVAELLSNAIQVIDNTNFDVAAASIDIRTELKQRWNDLIVVASTVTATTVRVSAPSSNDDCDDDDDSGNDDDDWFRKIYDQHNESGRYYHTPVHLWEMFALLEIVLPQLERQQQQQKTMMTTPTSTQEDKKDEESSFDDIQPVSTTTSAVAAEIADNMDGNKKKNSTHRCRYYIPIAWAILFHDAVYDPKSNRNEQESATLFLDFSDKNKEMMKRNFNSNRADNQNDDDDDDDNDNDNETKNNNKNKNNKEMTHRLTLDTVVSTLILATEKHQVIIPTTAATTNNDNNSNTTGGVNTIGSNTDDAYLYYYTIEELVLLQQFFLDIDMAVLGKRKHAYLHYAGLIRNEYSFVPKMVYCTERAKILESFFLLSKNNKNKNKNKNKSNTGENKYIYLTNTFREAFEERARENLKEEIQLLRRNIIPGEVEEDKD